MLPTKVLALLSAMSATTLAFDVYSTFYLSDGVKIGSTNFDVSNDGCFTVNSAETVSFSQHDATKNAAGPYCLTSYTAGGCGTIQGRQQFANVDVVHNSKSQLNSGIANAPSFSWATGACP